LLISQLPAYEHDPLVQGLEQANAPVLSMEAGKLDGWLEDRVPRAILVGPAQEALVNVTNTVRSNPAFSMVPIIWVRPDITGMSFEKAYAVGADDVAERRAPEGIVRRVLSTPETPSAAPEVSRGLVLVVDRDNKRRPLLGRALHNAGFEVRFALTLGVVVDASEQKITGVLTSADFGSEAIATSIEQARAKGIAAPGIISTPPKTMSQMSERLEALQPAVIYDGYAPIENVLFVLNDTLSGFVAENRASPRLLYGATVSFRVAGIETSEVGYCYNISDGGLYVRTLAPLTRGDEAWIELQPPRSPRRVRLDAKVVWARKHGGTKVASVPPGFGGAITGGSDVDQTMYSNGYSSFAKDLSGVRLSIRPESSRDPSVLPLR
jgi:Tfp pilus assembly protein PilZ